MTNDIQVGDWVEYDGKPYLVYLVSGGYVYYSLGNEGGARTPDLLTKITYELHRKIQTEEATAHLLLLH